MCGSVRAARSTRSSRAALVTLAWLAGCGSSSKDGGPGVVGKAAGAALGAAMTAAAAEVEPWRCARIDDAAAARLDAATQAAPRIAFLAEARGAGDATAPALEAARQALDAAPVDVVVTLGGMGTTRDEIGRALTPLAQGAPWLTVAIPGDRESIPEHRAAVAALAAAGARIVDGSQVRVVDLGRAVLGTLPGAPAGRIGAGAQGCLHVADDVSEILAELAARAAPAGKGKPRPTLLATQRAPRGATDLAPGGIRAGDVALARLLAEAPVGVVVHGAVDDLSSRAGAGKPAPALAVAVGAIDGTVRYRPGGARVRPSLQVVTVGATDVSWKPLAPTVVP